MKVKNDLLDEGAVRDSLATAERRTVVEVIETAETPVERTQIAHALDPDDPDRVEIELYHRHLPKLASAGVVDWDRTAGTISEGENFHVARELKG